MCQASFVLNFNAANFSSASQDFPKSNVVELERSKWYLGIEKTQSSNLNYSKVLDIFLTCERGATNQNYLANLTLILRGSFLDLNFSRMYYFEPMDLEMPCLKIDYNCILDESNGFINDKGECEITAEISVDRIDCEEEAGIERIFKGSKDSRSPPKRLDGVINLHGHCVRVNKELFSWHSEYFKNIFNNEHFEECSQDSIDLIDFTYKQFRLLYKHIYVESVYLPGQTLNLSLSLHGRYLYTDGVVEFRLKSEDGTKESQKLWTLADVRETAQQHTTLQAQDDSSEKSSSKTLSVLNVVDQVEALRILEWFFGSCVSAEYEGNVNLTVSAENIEDLLSVGSYFQITKIMDSCKEFLFRKYDYPDFSSDQRVKLVEKYNLTSVKTEMCQASFVLNFNAANFSSASQDFPKSNVVELERSKWYLGIEKTQSSNLNYSKVLDIFLTCERGATNQNYLANLTLILRGSFLDLNFSRMYYFEPMDLEMPCLKIDYNCILDESNGFINDKGECEITAEISVDRIDCEEEAGIERIFKGSKDSRSPPKRLDGVINLHGHCVRVNKELFSWHSEYFKNIFNNEHFEECSQDSIDLIDFTYKQFRLLYKHIYVESVYLPGRYLYTDGVVEFRLKSEDGTKESQKLWTLADVRETAQQHTTLQAQDDSSEKSSSKTLSVLNVVDQVEALRILEWFFGSCVSAEYEGNVNLTVSAENIEDLLSVGSYFQITKIMDSCKEFLFRKYDYPDFSSDQRVKLVEKYNLTSVKVPSFLAPTIIPRNSTCTEILVNVNFLDTGKEEMCSVNYEDQMIIDTLYKDALTSLYSTGACDAPSQYKLVNVCFSNPNMDLSTDCECVDVGENRTFIYGIVWISRIYSFQVRQLKAEVPNQMSDFSASQSQPRTSMVPSEVSNISSGSLSDSSFTEILAQVNFLDTGNEEMCSVKYEILMTIQSLFSNVFKSLYANGICEPKCYKLENVRVSDPNSPSADSQIVNIEDNPSFIYYVAHSFRIYSFGVRQIAGEASGFESLKSKATPLISNEAPSTSYKRFLPRTIALTREQSTSKSDSFSRANNPKSILTSGEISTNVYSFEDFEETGGLDNTILVYVTYLDTGFKKMCTLPHYTGLSVEKLFNRALLRVYVSDTDFKILPPREYELESVRIFYPVLSTDQHKIVPLDVNDIMSECVLSSQTYSFDVKRKSENSTLQFNASTSNKDSIPGMSSEFSKVPSTELAHIRKIKRRGSIQTLVQLIFLDSEEEKTVTVMDTNEMTIRNLFSFALLTLSYISSDYEIVTVHARYADSTSDGKPHSFYIPINVNSTVNSSYAYSFVIRRKASEPSTSKECSQDPWKFIKLDDV
ncbi:BTB/POZ domain-containing protein [Ditylenchus destructor]|uniref:BTB/POZ domain-containing protein n=1 Tax=Ditylenchus destructor TaxID=166010 RepID=A0AAD4MXN6_9BILA|nr:BTB/POZ domain-containing protein [Ditylenchus destructor]